MFNHRGFVFRFYTDAARVPLLHLRRRRSPRCTCKAETSCDNHNTRAHPPICQILRSVMRYRRLWRAAGLAQSHLSQLSDNTCDQVLSNALRPPITCQVGLSMEASMRYLGFWYTTSGNLGHDSNALKSLIVLETRGQSARKNAALCCIISCNISSFLSRISLPG